MRSTLRLLVLAGLVSSTISTGPLATAQPSPAPVGAVRSTPTPGEPSTPAAPTPARSPSTSASPSPSTNASPSPSLTPTARPSAGGSGLPSLGATTSSSASRSLAAGSVAVTLSDAPPAPSLSRSPTFGVRAAAPGVAFQCRLRGGTDRRDATFTNCPRDVVGSGGTATTVTTTYKNVLPSTEKYTFTVQAVPVGDPATVLGSASYGWRVYSVYKRGTYSPARGASFNRPLAARSGRRRNLAKMIRTINTMPGYLQPTKGAPCPIDRALWPSTIRVSLYSMTDRAFSSALRAADRRCVSVQILMNNHLSAATDPAWAKLQKALGAKVTYQGRNRRSFARRCHFGCRGRGVLHTKMYLFDSNVPSPKTSANKVNSMVAVGSSNMTSNAASVQWNDLYTVRGRDGLYSDFLSMFNRMRSGKKSTRAFTFRRGPYTAFFWPRGSGTDPYQKLFGSVRCMGATGGSGIAGRTVVYINSHAWFGTRGYSLARQVRGLYNKGCYVRVLYSFLSFKVFKLLTKGAGSRMSVRRTLFSRNGRTAYVYSHFKNIDISGRVGGDSSKWVVYTGSNNFTNSGTRFDEVMLRNESRAAYVTYVKKFKAISTRKSSATYANYSEPVGGGRAPG